MSVVVNLTPHSITVGSIECGDTHKTLRPYTFLWSTSCGRVELNIPYSNAKKAYHQNRLDDVKVLSENQTKLIDKNTLIDVLSEYGVWDNTELQDHDQNILRLLGIACADMVEQTA